MKISILSYSFRGLLGEGKMDVFGYLETCKYRYNLSAADIWSGFFPNTDEDFIKKLKEGLDERDMTLADLCVDGAIYGRTILMPVRKIIRELWSFSKSLMLLNASLFGWMPVDGIRHGQMSNLTLSSAATRNMPNLPMITASRWA